MPVLYTKPHLTYLEQLALLRGRGLDCPDEAEALRLLRTVGYYRLSAYVYPFRQMLPADQRRRESPVHHRAEAIMSGTTMDDVEAIWSFDRKLRLLVLDAVECVEIGLRTKIAYALGARDSFGHLRVRALNRKACDERYWRDGRNADTRHEVWVKRFRSDVASSKEDFVRHNLHKYNELPIWIAVETLTFGAMVRFRPSSPRRSDGYCA